MAVLSPRAWPTCRKPPRSALPARRRSAGVSSACCAPGVRSRRRLGRPGLIRHLPWRATAEARPDHCAHGQRRAIYARRGAALPLACRWSGSAASGPSLTSPDAAAARAGIRFEDDLGKFPSTWISSSAARLSGRVKTLRGTRGNGVLLCGVWQLTTSPNCSTGPNPAPTSLSAIHRHQPRRDARAGRGKAIAAMERQFGRRRVGSNISTGGRTPFALPPAMAGSRSGCERARPRRRRSRRA